MIQFLRDSHLLSDVVHRERLLDPGRDHLRVQISGDRRHLVDGGLHVGGETPPPAPAPSFQIARRGQGGAAGGCQGGRGAAGGRG